MKKLVLVASAVVLTFGGACKKKSTGDTTGSNNGGGGTGAITVENKQRSFLGYVTATWCGPCGAYGGPSFKQALATKTDAEIIMLNLQTSSSRLTPYFKRPSSMNNPDSVYICPVVNGLFNSLAIPTTNGSYSIPAFSQNNFYLGTSNTSSSTIVSNTTSFNQNAPELGVGGKLTITGNTIKVDAKVKFFKEGMGEYYYCVLVLEDHLNGYQLVGSTADNNYEHKNIVRASMQSGLMYNQTTFGTSFANGTVPLGTEFTKTFTLNYENYTAANVNPAFQLLTWNMTPASTKVAVMVWQKIGSNYAFVNGVMVK